MKNIHVPKLSNICIKCGVDLYATEGKFICQKHPKECKGIYLSEETLLTHAAEQKQHIIDMMKSDEELGLYEEPKQETNMSNITANQLIKDWKKTLESEWIQLDNLDEAKLVFDEEGNVVVENEHGTQFPVSDLSDAELDIFYTNLI
jgi:hypothetical protein